MFACQKRKISRKKNNSFFGFKNKITSRNRHKSSGWRFVSGILTILLILFVFLPLDFIITSIKAIGGNPEVIKLYPANFKIDNPDESFQSGWWNTEKLVGDVDLSPSAGLIEFSDTNSAFYSGGNAGLVLSGFRFLEDDLRLVDTEKINQYLEENDQYISDIITEVEIIENTASDILGKDINSDESNDVGLRGLENIQEEENNEVRDMENFTENKTEELIEGIQGGAKEEEISESIEDIQDDESGAREQEEVKIVEPESDDDMEAFIEVFEESVEEVIVEVITEEEDMNEEQEISWFKKMKSSFTILIAHAKEKINDKLTSLFDLGEFKKAKIKFSFAMNVDVDMESRIKNQESRIDGDVFEDLEVEIEENSIEKNFIEEDSKDSGELFDVEVLEDGEDNEYFDEIENEIMDNDDIEDKTEVIKDDVEDSDEVLDEMIIEEEVKKEITNIKDERSKEELSRLQKIEKWFSLASANARTTEASAAKIIIWYSLSESADDEKKLWQKLDTLNGKRLSNSLNGGYFNYDAPFLESWEDVERLNIKFEAYSNNQMEFSAYLDSVWVEAEFEPSEKMIKIKKRQKWQDALELLSGQIDFKVNETGELKFRFNRKKLNIFESLSEFLGLASFWQDINIRAELLNNFGEKIDLPLTMIFEEDGEFTIKLPEYNRELRPGKYSIKFIIEDSSGDELEIIEIKQDFSWGVLAINANKSVYTVDDESAYLQMAVLDNYGRTICDADLYMTIESPNGIVTEMSTDDGLVVRNDMCNGDTVISLPDYYAHYMLYSAGEYKINLSAATGNGFYSIQDRFEVREYAPFDIERAGPTRIYPKAEYDMVISVKANEDFSGDIVEYVPEGFEITNYKLQITNNKNKELELGNYDLEISNDTNKKNLKFKDVVLNQGDIFEFNYTFDAPDESPEFYLLGPAELIGFGTGTPFAEARSWQIASDAPVISTSTNGVNVNWTNPGNAWDNGTDTYASRDIPKKTSGGEPANYIQSSVNSATDLGGVINSVEIGIEAYVENTTVSAYLVAYFDGTTAGTIHSIAGATLGTASSDITNYVTITTEGPGSGNWTWDDIMNLDIRVYGGNSSNSANRFLYIDQIRIRVDYTANTPPNATFLSAKQRVDDSGIVDISIQVSDANNDDSRARLDYVLGADCDFNSPLDPTLDAAEANATSSILDVDIDNDWPYQVGTTTDLIRTTSANDVHFDWTSLSDISNADGTYCLRITANDFDNDDATPATTTVVIDNKAPTAPGVFSGASTTKSTAVLYFGATSTETHFDEYRVYYSTSTPVTENDYLHSSSTDENLTDIDFYGAATTTITDLLENTIYYFSLFAYDEYGHVSSSTPEDFTTNKTPLGVFSTSSPAAQRTDGSGIIDITIEVDDFNNDHSKAKIEYATGSDCIFSPAGDPALDETQSNINPTYGVPKIENDNEYQMGMGAEFWIQTPATNTIEFDWFGKTDLPIGDDTYCLRLTVNDGKDDQNISATATLTIDNVNPTAPGNLSEYDVGTSTIILNFGATTTETNFTYYKIYYKAGISGVSESDDPHVDDNLNDLHYDSAATTTIGGLISNTDYVINIWAYDDFGSKASATEVVIKTAATISNDSLTFVNPTASNWAVAGEDDEWTFRAVVSEENGWQTINNVVLRLANETDNATPFSDLEFTWNQTADVFTKTGADANSVVILSNTSTSTCADNTCTLDFNLIFNHNFFASGTNYSAELYSSNDGALTDFNTYVDFYQVKIVKVKQIHYRWRNDDGGE
ncbi:hypothetical protein KAU09_01155 [Candidatus Parcubacteria bacterium]|nr:hypothetical protein [Candidatus Parcubacteria bacterium]